MKADQAIFTSLSRRGKAGYHLVAKSEGLSPGEAAAIEAWCPSHGALTADTANRASINFHQLATGRFVVSRTIEARQEYSGRGGKQLYTHLVVFDALALESTSYQPFAIYRDVMARGYLVYQAEPPRLLQPLTLSSLHLRADHEAWEGIIKAFGRSEFEALVYQLEAERPVIVPYSGDRSLLAEALLGHLTPQKVPRLSFATSLQPSNLRPLTLQIVST